MLRAIVVSDRSRWGFSVVFSRFEQKRSRLFGLRPISVPFGSEDLCPACPDRTGFRRALSHQWNWKTDCLGMTCLVVTQINWANKRQRSAHIDYTNGFSDVRSKACVCLCSCYFCLGLLHVLCSYVLYGPSWSDLNKYIHSNIIIIKLF